MPSGNIKYVAWGASPIFEIYMHNAKPSIIEYCVDSSIEKHGKQIEDITIFPTERLFNEESDSVIVINFGHSSNAIQSINKELCANGFTLGVNCFDCAEFMKSGFKLKVNKLFENGFNNNFFTYARSFNFNSSTSLETTVLGNWLLLEILNITKDMTGSIAEIGAFKGGNALLLLNAMSLWNDSRNYYILDSFQGFDTLTDHDPIELKDVYNYDYNFDLICNTFSIFQHAKLIRGFVPSTFKEIPEDEKFSVVFYDCDLYQPALDTFDFFWDKIENGGYLVIHDNIATKDGWTGVKKATSEYFEGKDLTIYDFWETTMSVIKKTDTCEKA